MATTIYKIAEQILDILEGDTPSASSSVDLNTMKIAIGQVINQMLRVEHLQVNEAMGEKIANGSVLGWYENIDVVTSNGKSKCSLPIKPMKLPRNMGIFAVYPRYETNGNYELDKEFIPLQMGQAGLLRSQPMINELLGQVGYENYGMEVVFTKDIKSLFPDVKLAMRLAIMDISEYGDYDILPILPEQEWAVVQEVYKVYSTQPVPSRLVDATTSEDKGTPVNQQKQA